MNAALCAAKAPVTAKKILCSKWKYYQYSETQKKRSLKIFFYTQLELPVEQLTTMGDEGVCVADVHIAAEEQPKAGQEQHYNPK